jgi:4,5-DOPA dioxygenase extradiol
MEVRSKMTTSQRTPVVFFGHGSPTEVLEDSSNTKAWLEIAKTIGTPKAILCISAHWCTPGIEVTAMENPRTIHDFGRGLPAPLFDMQYPAPGSPALAERIRQLLDPLPVKMDDNWGFDHANWIVLSKAYPDADVPVIQMSMDASKPISWHFELGRMLRPLRDEGILIMGTGNVVHNLSQMNWDINSKPHDWAQRFNDLVIDCIENNTPERLFDHKKLGRDAALSIPPEDLGHYWPLFYVLGARHPSDRLTLNPTHVQFQSLSMLSVLLDDRAA